MNKVTTLQKLIGFALLLSLFPIAIGVYAVNSLHTISNDLDTLYSVHMMGLDKARALNVSVLRSIRDEKNLILSNDSESINRFVTALDKEHQAIDDLKKSLPQCFVTDTGKRLLSKMLVAVDEWRKVHSEIIQLGRTTDEEIKRKGTINVFYGWTGASA